MRPLQNIPARLGILLGLVLLLAFSACAGSKTREHTLWPVIKSSWPEVRNDVTEGLPKTNNRQAVETVVDEFQTAVDADKREQVRGINWLILEPVAKLGVDARVSGGLSEGVAQSRLERIDAFFDALGKLVNTTTTTPK